MSNTNFTLFISGPTGVGKSDLALKLAQNIPAEIVNADVGQFYTPLSIGTAKPDWRNSLVPHHLFDVLDKPVHFTSWEYRKRILDTISDIVKRGKLPIVVGGSGFYLKSLFFPPKAFSGKSTPSVKSSELAGSLWKKLYAIDPKRAVHIHKNDTYRIQRALAIWEETGIEPSEYRPTFNYPSDFLFLWVTRDRRELYQRINERTNTMLTDCWVEEVARLRGTPWEPFLRKKKLIGYDVILDYLEMSGALDIEKIRKLTRNYAKRQETFWRMLESKLHDAIESHNKKASLVASTNLTLLDLDLYISQLSEQIKNVSIFSGEK